MRVLLVSGLLALSQSFAQIGEVRVGAVLPPGASPALEAVRNGLRMGEKEYDLNARLLGGRFQVLIRSAQTATAAAQAADSLVAQGASALVGGFSGQAPALARVAQARRIPFLNIGDPSDRLRNEACNPYMFHLEASAAMYLDALATWFVRAGLRTWFLVYGGPEGGICGPGRVRPSWSGTLGLGSWGRKRFRRGPFRRCFRPSAGPSLR